MCQADTFMQGILSLMFLHSTLRFFPVVTRQTVWRWLALAVSYGAIAKLGNHVPYIPQHRTDLVTSGFSNRRIDTLGRDDVPSNFVSALLLNLTNNIPLTPAVIMALGSMLGPLIVHWDLRRADFDGGFVHRGDVVKFVIAALVGMTVPATVGHLLMATQQLPDLRFAWISWWAADLVGVFFGDTDIVGD